ncbi:MAG: PspA/IM30 family protein [Pseudomonadota bacterium]
MTIFNRIGTVVKSNVNSMITDLEEPEKMLTQALLDMQQQLVESKKQVALAIADEKRLAKQLENERAQSAEWERKAMLAVKAGNDELAKEALMRKQEHDKLTAGFQEQWTGQKAAVDQLKSSLTQLNNKIEDAKRKKNLLIARAKRAEAQKTIANTMSGMQENSAFDNMQRMEEKIDKLEAEAKATFELASDFSGDTLDKKFAALETVEADDALAALKAKMGMQTAAAIPEATAQASQSTVQSEVQSEVEATVGSKGSAEG